MRGQKIEEKLLRWVDINDPLPSAQINLIYHENNISETVFDEWSERGMFIIMYFAFDRYL